MELQNEQHKHTKKRSPNAKRRTYRKIVSLLLSYILSILLVILYALVGLLAGVFNDNVILDRLNKSNYYQSIYATIQDNIESVLLPTGLDVTVIDDVITKEMVYIGARNTIEGAIKGKTVIQDTKGMENKLKANIKAYAEEHGIANGGEQQAGMNLLCEMISKEYRDNLEFPFMNYYVRYKALYLNIVQFAIPIIIVMAALVVVFLLRIQHYKHRGVRYIAYSTLASSIMISVLPAVLLAVGAYRRINVSPRYFYNFMVSYLAWDIEVFLYIGAISLIFFSGLLLLIKLMKKRIN